MKDSPQSHKQNIWQQAMDIKSKDIKTSITQKTFIVGGPPSSGKTSFIKVFKSDLDFQTKPTNLIQYTYIKKTGIKKQIIHCYQIASKSLSDIICSFLTKDNFYDVTFILCLDLSHPGNLIDLAIEWLNILRTQSQKFIKDKLVNKQQKYMEFTQSLIDQYADNQDKNSIEPMPFQTIIIGTKYDLFQKYDTQSRKWLARALRYIAHHNNCSLYFCSTKNIQVGAQLRGYFQQRFKLDKKNKTLSQVDHIKPIFINNGQDTIRSMSLPVSGSLNTFQILKKQLISLFGQQQDKKKQQIDFTKFGQTRIDTIIAQKKKEIQKINKLVQNNQFKNNRKI